MSNYLSSPNMLVIYDFADAVGQFHIEVELIGENTPYPHGWDGVPADVYFSFDPDDARDAADPAISFADQMSAAGYEVDITCQTGEIGVVLHVTNYINEDALYTIYTKTGDNSGIYDDQLFTIEEGLDSFLDMPVAWQHDWWYISECY